jgi:hypothetical protein
MEKTKEDMKKRKLPCDPEVNCFKSAFYHMWRFLVLMFNCHELDLFVEFLFYGIKILVLKKWLVN